MTELCENVLDLYKEINQADVNKSASQAYRPSKNLRNARAEEQYDDDLHHQEFHPQHRGPAAQAHRPRNRARLVRPTPRVAEKSTFYELLDRFM